MSFGASADLALRRRLPALGNLASKGLPADGFHVVGVSRHKKTSDTYRAEVHSQAHGRHRPRASSPPSSKEYERA